MDSLEGQTVQGYEIGRRLGAGGMGTVHVARVRRARRHLPAGTEVAIKLLHPHLARDEEIVKRFRREARIGLELDHPRVVRTLDVGSARIGAETVQYLVMELLEGKTLRARLDADGPLDDPTAARLGAQVADGLRAIHAAGMVHRDIKPANVFLDAEGNAKVADLGLSRLLEPKSEISLPGTFVGSVAYAAPEQLEGEEVGPEADLYALGVTLYESVSGRNPFSARDLKATMHAQQHLVPAPLGRVARGASWFLDRVVAALLTKDPARRLGPAGRVGRILREREGSEWWWQFVRGEGEAGEALGPRRQLKVRRATRVYGRGPALARVEDSIRTAVVGRSGTVTLLVGEAGSGKSRLIDAALEGLERDIRGARVVVSRFLDLAASTPFYPLDETVRRAFELHELPRDARRGPLVEKLTEHLPERSALAPAFAALIDGKDVERSVATLPSDAIPALYAEVFRTLSVRAPLVLVLEEVQWADRGSLRVLERLTEALQSFPIALVLTARDAHDDGHDTEEDGPRATFLRAMEARSFTTRVDLTRLDRRAVRSILRDLGVLPEAEKRLAARLLSVSEGNPGFLFALLEDLGDRAPLARLDADALNDLPLPTSIVDFLHRRLEDLDGDARRFLEFAAVIGTRFKLEPVMEGLGLDLVTATQVASRLMRRYRLIRAFDRAYRFDHHLLREHVYRGISAARRREMHALVAESFARDVSDPAAPSRAGYEAAVHFSLAEAHAPAARHLVGAVRWLTDRSLHERADRLARTACQHLEALGDAAEHELTASERRQVWTARAAVSGHLGRRDVQGDALRRAARIAHDSEDDEAIARTEVLLSRHAGATARFFTALQHAGQAKAAARRAERPGIEAAALRVEAAILRTLGQTDYEDLLREADRLSAEVGDEEGRAYGLLLLAQLYLATDRPELALDTLRDARTLFVRLEDRRGRARVLFHVARVYREFGDLRRAIKAIDAATGVAEANSDRSLLARCLYLQGELALRRRAFREASDKLTSASAELAAAEDKTFQVYTLIALALLRTARHNPDRDPVLASETAERAVRLSQELTLARQEAYAYAVLAFTYLARDKPEFALAVSRKGMRFLEQQPVGRKREAEIRFLHSRCLKRLGQTEEAALELERARALVRARAAEIAHPAFRRAFLELDLFNVAVLRKEGEEGEEREEGRGR